MARSRPRARRRRALGAVLVLILLGLVSGYVALDIRDVVPGVLTDDPPWLDADPFPAASLPSVPAAEEVLSGPSPTAPLPTADGLAALSAPVLADPRVGPDSGVLVTDVLTGADLFTATPQTARVPASTLKILVAVAALETMGDQRTFTTRVMNGADGEVVLVGGGDMMLASDAGDAGAVVGHAGLGDLADEVAEELSAEGRSTTRVVLDDSLFTGPRLGPNWGAADVNGGWAMPIMPIAVDIGIVEGRTVRESDPALAAAGAFAQALAARGITVQGEATRGLATSGAAELASVESAPLRDVVAYTLQHSENILSEVLGRMTADALGQQTSFAGAGVAVRDVLTGLGVDTTGMNLVDASGLSSLSTVTPRSLVQAVRLIADGSHPELLSVVHALPVAGLEGTLAERLSDTDAAGVLMAKTGTLPQVVSLAGLVVTADGRLLAFAFIANNFERGAAYQARLAIDDWAAGLAGCGCS